MSRRRYARSRSVPVAMRRRVNAVPTMHTHRLARKDGAVLYLAALMMFVFLGITALAIDLGDWFVGRSEAQRAAEAGAHAGASVFMSSGGDEAAARAEAELFAERNVVRGVTPDVFPVQDIDVILDSQKVRVRVQRSAARGNPVATIFARAMGINTVDIGAVAAAQVWPGDGTDCVLPFAIPDLWTMGGPPLGPAPPAPNQPRTGGYPDMDDVFDPAADYYYSAASTPPGAYYTGYGIDKVGWLTKLTTADPAETPQEGWYYPIRLPGSKGAKDYKESIINCWDPPDEDVEFEIGDYVDKEPGNMVGPTLQAFTEVMALDPYIYWDTMANCPKRPGPSPIPCIVPGPNVSPRLRPLVLFDPTTWPDIDNGAKPVEITGFGGIYIDSFTAPNDVWVRWVEWATISPASDWEDNSESLLRVLRIVE